MNSKLLGSDALMEMVYSAEDMDREVVVYRSEIDDEIILYVEIDGETYHNDFYEDEMDRSDESEARRYYYG